MTANKSWGPKRLWTVEEVADYYDVTVTTVHHWKRSGGLPVALNEGRGRGRRIWFDPDVVRNFERPKRGNPHPSFGRYYESARVIPTKDYVPLARLYASGKFTFQELADEYGVSRERIRQIVKKVDPTIDKRVRLQRDQLRDQKTEAAQWTKLWRLIQSAIDEDLHCPVCEAWVIRARRGQPGDHPTCSSECTKVWTVLRHFDQREDHRRMQAHSILNNPAYKGTSKWDWAQRMLSDDPPPPNRTYFRPGSKRAELIRKYRPNEFNKILDGMEEQVHRQEETLKMAALRYYRPERK